MVDRLFGCLVFAVGGVPPEYGEYKRKNTLDVTFISG